MIGVDDIEKLARTLCGDTAPEARIRCAIGRAYYAAYHYAKVAADTWCGQLTEAEEAGKGSHEKLYLRLRDHSKDEKNDAALRQLAEEAKKARTLRHDADYALDKSITRKDLDRTIHYMSNVKIYYAQLVGEAGSGPTE
jgi:hypothetical protein